VIFGGGEAGTATIKNTDPDLPVPTVELDSPVRIHGATMAFAVPLGYFPEKEVCGATRPIVNALEQSKSPKQSLPLRELNPQTQRE
jgi:hypothetical protein